MDAVFAKCGTRCDLCLIYRPNVEREDRRAEICGVWKKQRPNFDGNPSTIICDGCASTHEDAVSRTARLRSVCLRKDLPTAATVRATPAKSFLQSPRQRRLPA